MLGFLLSPVLQIEDIDGKPLVGGKVFVYEANTSNLATVYKDYNGTFNTNPVILDTAGHNTIIAEDNKLYDITVKDANDNLLFSVEDVAVGGEGGSAIVTDITVQAGNNGIAVGQSVVSGVKTFKVSADYNFLASKTDLANKQDKLSAGPNIDITNNVVSGKDWQSEIDAAVDAVATGFIPYSATNIPAGSSVSIYGDNMLLVGKNITGIAYGNLAVGENIYKTAPNGLMAGSGINGSQNNILVGNGVSAGNNALVLGDSISSLGNSIIIGGPSITGKYGDSTIVVGNNNLTGMGNHNVVLGHANTATSGNDNVIIGRGNSTTGSENIVIGIDNSSNSGTVFGGIYNQVNNFGYVFGGSYNSATNAAAVLNGDGCYASGTGSVAEGIETSALGDDSHAEGNFVIATGYASHAEGDHTYAEGIESHAEGGYTSAIGNCSHSEGHDTIASANYSHAGGHGTSALGEYQTVFGKYNNPNTGDIFQIGCGTFGSPSNTMTVDASGSVNVKTSAGLKNTRTFFDNIGNATYNNTRDIPIHPCTGLDFVKITTTGATGYYAVCPQTFIVPNAKKVKVDGFYQIKGGMNTNGGVPNFGADPKIETWIIDDNNNSAVEVNAASLTNGYYLPRSVPIPFSFVTGGTTAFRMGFCTEGTWTATNMDVSHGSTAGNLVISYTTTILDQE